MSDIFCETIVKKKRSMQDMMKIVGLLAITAILIVLFPLIPFVGFFIAVGMVAIDYVVIRRLSVEFEYALTMTDLDVAKIMAKEKRKQLLTLDLKQAIVIAPEGHTRLQEAERDNAVSKVYDYTSGEAGRKVYVVIGKKDTQTIKLRFEPTENMIHGIRQQLPSKTVVE